MGILICGLNGAGKSTLGRALASRMGYEFIDNEDLYFPKKDSGYRYSDPRSEEEVIQALESRIRDNHRFVFAAVIGDYGDKLINALDHIILVEVPKEVRIRRVKARSLQKHGAKILPDGELYEKEQKWFTIVENRPEDYVLAWLETIKCPVTRVDGTLPVEDNVKYLMSVFP
ncbi:MAG: AAA family ATPase [Clostridia bacterium]|nr:AAA family ATPase [Clostridia bacterium]